MNGQPQGHLEDDGSGQEHTDLTDVTYVKEKFIYPVTDQNAPSFGKPRQLYEKYMDQATGRMVERTRTDFYYNERGSEISRKVYDSEGRFCYDINRAYDGRLRTVYETDPLGNATIYEYHENNKISKEEQFGSGKFTLYHYDRANRLSRKEEHHQNGEVFATTYTYNALNQLISETDPYGHETVYEYSRLGWLKKTIKPAMELVTGSSCRPAVAKKYNVLGYVTSQTDENGHTTHYSPTVRGDPLQITHPDGSVERCIYYPCGWLKQKWETDGTSTSYTYDPKGRMLTKTLRDETGALLKQAEWRYKGDLLIYKKDPMGLETFYRYDGAGRKIEEKILDKVTHYIYDDLNRPVKISTLAQCEILQYDWLDRIVSKTWQDTHGKIYGKTTYAYDIQGNLIEKAVQQSDHRTAVYKSHYDSDGSLLWTQDPLGHRKTWQYNHHHHNGWAQQVQCRAIHDELGRATREADDAHHRRTRKDICEHDLPVSITHFHYDPIGHLVKQSTRVMDHGRDIREYAVQWDYNHRGLLTSEAELPQGGTTHFAYDAKGRLTQKTKPDGTALHYTYDPLNRLTKLTSSDGTIAYTYLYDLHDNPIEIQDLVHATSQRRRYDLFDRLIEEEISPGNILRYQYDPLDRLTQITLPDAADILYEYDPFHLRSIKRPSYAISCAEYDQRGNLLKISTPAGTINYEYDLLGRAVAIRSAVWESHLEQFDPVGNLLMLRQKDPDGEHLEHFTYDRFNHLTSEDTHQYRYDSLGNCLEKNQTLREINGKNQTTHDGQSAYTYDLRGNLIAQTNPSATYNYDALDRLISCEKEGQKTSFTYDAFNRCLQITDGEGTKQLIYQGKQEIGSILDGKIQEFRLMHPREELTFSIERNGKAYFPIQDHRHNICALHQEDGRLAEWYRYAAFGEKTEREKSLSSWRFANRRQVADLTLFTHRFYNPQLRCWLTSDPLRFADGMNLYAYTHNNPFKYTDPNGQMAFVIPLFVLVFGEAAAITFPVSQAVTAAIVFASVAAFKYHVDSLENRYNQIQTDEERDARIKEIQKEKEKKNEWVFPENPDDLLPEIPRDEKGRIQPADNLRIRPEKHEFEEGRYRL